MWVWRSLWPRLRLRQLHNWELSSSFLEGVNGQDLDSYLLEQLLIYCEQVFINGSGLGSGLGFGEDICLLLGGMMVIGNLHVLMYTQWDLACFNSTLCYILAYLYVRFRRRQSWPQQACRKFNVQRK